ncbi:MAG: hypothetical protein AAGA77_02535 [Bacteroidota bacterium]
MILKIKKEKILYKTDDHEYLETDITITLLWIPIYTTRHKFDFESYESDPGAIGY